MATEIMQKPTMVYGVGPITRIEQLRRLLKERRFSNDIKVEQQVHEDRTIYIEKISKLAIKGKYSEGRVRRLGHEVNRSFGVQLSPNSVDEIINSVYNSNDEEYDIDDWLIDLGVTKEEYIKILGTLA